MTDCRIPARVTASDLPMQLPTGRARIEGWENWLFCDAIGAEPSYDAVHPGLGFVACARGSAVSLSRLLELVGCAPESGPMVVASDIQLPGTLEVDVDYDVEARILSLVPKNGRTMGSFDLLTHQFALVHPQNRTVFAYTGTIALPRRSS